MQARQLWALVGGCLLILGGCARQTNSPEGNGEKQAPEKVKVTAYINVTSNCQAETVDLLTQLATDNQDLVELDLVDFGDGGNGAMRWKQDGMDCMAILFNQSPVLKFPDETGKDKAVAFIMPVPFHWTHDDLELAFKAIRAGTLKILTEDEARREFGEPAVDLAVRVNEVDGGAELVIGESSVLTLKAEAEGRTAIERAKRAKLAIEKWAQEPIQPGDAEVVPEGSESRIMAKGIEIVLVTEADAKAAGAESVDVLAREWVRSIRISLVDALRATASEEQSGE